MGRSSVMETMGWLASIMMMLRRSDDWRRETSGKAKRLPTGKNETIGETAGRRTQHLGKLGLLRKPGNADVTKIQHIQIGKGILVFSRKAVRIRRGFRWCLHQQSHLPEVFGKESEGHFH